MYTFQEVRYDDLLNLGAPSLLPLFAAGHPLQVLLPQLLPLLRAAIQQQHLGGGEGGAAHRAHTCTATEVILDCLTNELRLLLGRVRDQCQRLVTAISILPSTLLLLRLFLLLLLLLTTLLLLLLFLL